eukprot:SAG22_NODE_1209_length_5162_cov_16.551649_4_plen_176_part_00
MPKDDQDDNASMHSLLPPDAEQAGGGDAPTDDAASDDLMSTQLFESKASFYAARQGLKAALVEQAGGGDGPTPAQLRAQQVAEDLERERRVLEEKQAAAVAKAEAKRTAKKKRFKQVIALEDLKDTLRAKFEAENPPEPETEGGDYLLAYAGPDGVPVIRKEDDDEEEVEWVFED